MNTKLFNEILRGKKANNASLKILHLDVNINYDKIFFLALFNIKVFDVYELAQLSHSSILIHFCNLQHYTKCILYSYCISAHF